MHCWYWIVLLIFLNANLNAILDNLQTLKSNLSLFLFECSWSRNGDEMLLFASKNEVLVLLHYWNWVALLIILNANWDLIFDDLKTVKLKLSFFLFKHSLSGNGYEMLWFESQNKVLTSLQCWYWIGLLILLNTNLDLILNSLETVISKLSFLLFKFYWYRNEHEALWFESENKILLLYCWHWTVLLIILKENWDTILYNLETVKSKLSLLLFEYY